jgi:nucleoid DNA-binding protein
MTLTKRDLVVRVSAETDLPQQQVYKVIQLTLDHIAGALARGEKVELRNFGVFEVKITKPRVGRNPHAPHTDVPIPPRCVVRFKSGRAMRIQVMQRPPTPPAAEAPAPPAPTAPPMA